jgi:peptidoglycan hydrolase CwlO-like protein
VCLGCRSLSDSINRTVEPLYSVGHESHCKQQKQKKAAEEEAARKAAEMPVVTDDDIRFLKERKERLQKEGGRMTFPIDDDVMEDIPAVDKDARIKELETEKEADKKQIDALLENVKDREMTIESYRASDSTLKVKIKELEADLERKTRYNEGYIRKNSEYRDIIRTYHGQISNLTAVNNELIEAKAKMQQEILNLTAELAKSVADRNEERRQTFKLTTCECGWVIRPYQDNPMKNGKCNCANCCESTDVYLGEHAAFCRQKKEERARHDKLVNDLTNAVKERDAKVTQLTNEIKELTSNGYFVYREPKLAASGSVNMDCHMGQRATMDIDFSVIPHYYTPGVCRVKEGCKDPLLGGPLIITLGRGNEHSSSLLTLPTTQYCQFVQSTSDNIELRFDRYIGTLILSLPKYTDGESPPAKGCGVDELAKTKALLDIATTEIKAKQAEVDQLRAEADGYEHERTRLKAKIGRLFAKLEKAKADFESAVERGDHYFKECDIAFKERDFYKNRQIHFKRYRHWAMCSVSGRLLDLAMNGGCNNPSDVDPYLLIFPELREAILEEVVARCERNLITHQFTTGPLFKYLIRTAELTRKMRNGAEHSPASGSTA